MITLIFILAVGLIWTGSGWLISARDQRRFVRYTFIGIDALQIDRERAVQALLMIERIGTTEPRRVAGLALDALEVDRAVPTQYFGGEQ